MAPVRVARSIKRYTKFVLVGVSNAVVDLAVLNLLMVLIPDHRARVLVMENTVAVACAIVNSYVLNRRWTFVDSSDGSVVERILFFFQALLNIGLNDWILAWCTTYLVFSRNIPVFVSSNASKAVAMFLSSSVSYVFMRFVVFRGVRRLR
ncbi:GtrA family protein [Alicyclobacillus curvatus]|nr:GtrA family protein [Alicyclobacillus curvatus]